MSKEVKKVNEPINEVKFSRRATELLAINIATRVLFILVVAPTSYYFWNRKGSLEVRKYIIKLTIGISGFGGQGPKDS